MNRVGLQIAENMIRRRLYKDDGSVKITKVADTAYKLQYTFLYRSNAVILVNSEL